MGMTSGIPISLYTLSFWVNSFDESFPRKVFLYVPNVPSITLLILSHVILLFEKNFFFWIRIDIWLSQVNDHGANFGNQGILSFLESFLKG